ncbi:MAG TPA: hypothetical protein VKT70_05950, partial [Stellaceae bacterium]|nr:hypothetical protein [Stellaceae bacterium]
MKHWKWSLLATSSILGLIADSEGVRAQQVVTGNAINITANNGTAALFLNQATVSGMVTNSGTVSPGAATTGGTIAALALYQSSVGGGITNGGLLQATSGASANHFGILVGAGSSIGGGITNSGTLSVSTINATEYGIVVRGQGTVAGGVVNKNTISLNGGGAAYGLYIQSGAVIAAGGITNAGRFTAMGAGTVRVIDITGTLAITGTSSLPGGISNSGTLQGSSTGASAYGIDLRGSNHGGITVTGGITNSGTITINTTAPVNAYVAQGISLANTHITGGIADSGLINVDAGTGANSGAGITLGLSMVSGDILVPATGAIIVTGGKAASGITLSITTLSGSITNQGKITATAGGGAAFGIKVIGTTGTLGLGPGRLSGNIVNSGTIAATGGEGVGILVSNATIVGGITNSGTLTGSTAAIDLSHANGATTILETGGVLGAVNFSNFGDTLTATGGTLTGAIAGGSGPGAANEAVNVPSGTFTLSSSGAIGTPLLPVAHFALGSGATLGFVLTSNTSAGAFGTIKAQQVTLSTGGLIQLSLNGAFPTIAPNSTQTLIYVDAILATKTLVNNLRPDAVKVNTVNLVTPTGQSLSFTGAIQTDKTNGNALDLVLTEQRAGSPPPPPAPPPPPPSPPT